MPIKTTNQAQCLFGGKLSKKGLHLKTCCQIPILFLNNVRPQQYQLYYLLNHSVQHKLRKLICLLLCKLCRGQLLLSLHYCAPTHLFEANPCSICLYPIILLRSTGFFFWYPPLPRLPFPSHLSQATLPLPLQILHGSWGYRTSKGLTNNPSPAPLFAEDLTLETHICFFQFLCSNWILRLG